MLFTVCFFVEGEESGVCFSKEVIMGDLRDVNAGNSASVISRSLSDVVSIDLHDFIYLDAEFQTSKNQLHLIPYPS